MLVKSLIKFEKTIPESLHLSRTVTSPFSFTLKFWRRGGGRGTRRSQIYGAECHLKFWNAHTLIPQGRYSETFSPAHFRTIHLKRLLSLGNYNLRLDRSQLKPKMNGKALGFCPFQNYTFSFLMQIKIFMFAWIFLVCLFYALHWLDQFQRMVLMRS